MANEVDAQERAAPSSTADVSTDRAASPGRATTIETLTRRALAARLSVHPITITKWEREGLPVAAKGSKGRPSLYLEVEVRAWVAARDALAKTGQGLNLVQERAGKERWQGRLAEQTYETRAKQLLPTDEVEKVWAAEVAAVRTVILASYTSQADRVFRAGTIDGLAGVERELKALAYEILRELATPARSPAPKRAKKAKAVAA